MRGRDTWFAGCIAFAASIDPPPLTVPQQLLDSFLESESEFLYLPHKQAHFFLIEKIAKNKQY